MADPLFALGVEFVSGSYTNVTSWCLQGQMHRQLATLFDPPREGYAMFTLSNANGHFSPQNSSSPYYPNVVPGKRIRLTATHADVSSIQMYMSSPSGEDGNGASTPNASSLNITGDLDLLICATANNWADSVNNNYFSLISKWNSSGAQTYEFGYYTRPTPSARPILSLLVSDGTAGPSRQSTVPIPADNGDTIWLRTTFDVDTGSAQNVAAFYISTDDKSANPASISWTQVGATRVNSGATSVFTGSAQLTVGGRSPNVSSTAIDWSFAGDIYRAQVRSGINGLLVADFNPGDTTSGDTSFVSSLTGVTWTINQSGASPATLLGGGFPTVFPLFQGRVVNYQLSPALNARTVLVEAADSVNKLVNTFIVTSLYTNTNAQSLFTVLMSEAAVNSFSVDTSITDQINYAWYQDEQVVSAMTRLVEFGNYKLYEDGAGTMRLKNRYWRQGDNSVASYGTTATSTGFYNLDLSFSQESVINRIKVSGQPRQQSSSVNTVAWLQEVMTIPGSSSIGFWVAYVDPVEPSNATPAANLISPVASTDWKLGVTSGGLAASLTGTGSLQITMFGAAAVCSLYNGSGNVAYLNQFQIRGNSVQLRPPISTQFIGNSSQAVYGKREFSIANDLFSSQAYVQDFAAFLLSLKKEPQPRVSFTLKNHWPDTLQRELGDLLSLVDSVCAINSQWLVTEMTHELALANGLEHIATYMVIPQKDYGWLVLDHATRGKLDTGRLGL